MDAVTMATGWVRFAQPWWLIGLAAAGAPLLLARRARRRGRGVGAASVALQVLAAAAGVLALAQPEAPLGRRAARKWLVLRDASASTRLQPRDADAALGGLPREVYDFADGVARADGPLNDARTLLGPALRLAGARAGQIAGVVLATDGRFQDEAAWPAAAALARAGARVLIVPLEAPPPDARVADLAAELAPDGACRVRVSVASNAMRRRTLTVRRAGAAEPLLQRELNLLAGESVTLRLTDAGEGLADAGARYVAELTPPDAFPENDAAETLALPRRQRVAFVGPAEGLDPAALAARLPAGIERIDPAAAPDRAEGWAPYATVVLQDATGELLPPACREALAGYVRSGGGLVLLGAGPHASPADRLDPLNRVSPLRANPYERRALRVIVVLDASGSMAEPAGDEAAPGRVKFDLAIEATLALKQHLTDRDGLAAITFCDAEHLVYDSGPARADFAALHEALRAVHPAGPTLVAPALARALAAAPNEPGEGLVLLLSDLQTQDRQFDPAAVAEEFRRRGLGLAVVLTGPAPGGPAPLERLAEALDAPIVRRDSLVGLAKVFGSFVRTARGEPVRRGQFEVAWTAEPFGRGPATLGGVDAYLLCGLQDDAERLGAIGADPVLARGRAGLGRAVALALPVDARDNAALRGSAALADILAGAAAWTFRPPGDPRFALTAARQGTRVTIEAAARDDAGPMNLLELVVRVGGGDEPPRSAAMAQVGPGRYRAELEAPPAAAAVTLAEATGTVLRVEPLPRTRPAEFAALGADWDALRHLAERTGGTIVSRDDLPALGVELAAERYSPLWPWLLAAATALMLIDWCTARVLRRG